MDYNEQLYQSHFQTETCEVSAEKLSLISAKKSSLCVFQFPIYVVSLESNEGQVGLPVLWTSGIFYPVTQIYIIFGDFVNQTFISDEEYDFTQTQKTPPS